MLIAMFSAKLILFLLCHKFPRHLKLCIQETQPHYPTVVVNDYYEVGWLTQFIDYHLSIKIAIYKLLKNCCFSVEQTSYVANDNNLFASLLCGFV